MFVIDALIYLAPTILVAVAALLIYFFLSEVNKQKSPPSQKRNPSAVRQRTRPRQKKKAPSNLEKQLIRMVHGDRATALRLFHGARRNYPGKSKQWYLEKVISDLERDRR